MPYLGRCPETSLSAVRILEFSGEELEEVAGEFSIPVIARTSPGFRGRAAIQELGETLSLTQTHWGQMSSVRTDRMAARASADNLMLFCVYAAGRAASASTTAAPN